MTGKECDSSPKATNSKKIQPIVVNHNTDNGNCDSENPFFVYRDNRSDVDDKEFPLKDDTAINEFKRLRCSIKQKTIPCDDIQR